jgi:predicted PurR-regulated permease PerM
VVDLLHRWRIPRAIGAAALLLAAVGSLGFMAYSLSDDASALVDSLPDASQKPGNSLHAERGAPEVAIEKVQRAATSLEDAADDSRTSAPLPVAGVTRVQVEPSRFNVSD